MHGPANGGTKYIASHPYRVGIAETAAAPFAGALNIGFKAKDPIVVSLPILTDLTATNNAIEPFR
jgi:hypothetical protein